MTARRCRSCGHPVLIAPSVVTGRDIVIDATPHPDGTVVLEDDGHARVIGTRIIPRDMAGETRPRHLPHQHRAVGRC